MANPYDSIASGRRHSGYRTKHSHIVPHGGNSSSTSSFRSHPTATQHSTHSAQYDLHASVAPSSQSTDVLRVYRMLDKSDGKKDPEGYCLFYVYNAPERILEMNGLPQTKFHGVFLHNVGREDGTESVWIYKDISGHELGEVSESDNEQRRLAASIYEEVCMIIGLGLGEERTTKCEHMRAHIKELLCKLNKKLAIDILRFDFPHIHASEWEEQAIVACVLNEFPIVRDSSAREQKGLGTEDRRREEFVVEALSSIARSLSDSDENKKSEYVVGVIERLPST
ncbi:hypothetical protein K474DRAFT_1680726 [Panus rudis PR-1116 ss-1]|nr:hypothetical protein K474DRAFT_1680726 [Panus rudis PR-1116 ss-1]